jgi:hypothetical protein
MSEEKKDLIYGLISMPFIMAGLYFIGFIILSV